jgi:predicted PurR-regulated permease PerM
VQLLGWHVAFALIKPYAPQMKEYPTPFQRNSMWTAISALSVTVTISIVVGLIYLGTRVISFLQPLLIPFAIAGVLAYLLEPVVARMVRWGIKRHRAVLLVFFVVTAALVGIVWGILPTIAHQGAEFVRDVPSMTSTASQRVAKFVEEKRGEFKTKYNLDLYQFLPADVLPGADVVPAPEAAPSPPAVGQGSAPALTPGAEKPSSAMDKMDMKHLLSGAWLKDSLAALGPMLWNFVKQGVGGFLGVFGFVLSMVIVPLYLYYFLTESAVIKEKWADYVPLRASQFKDEVVGTITDINRYLMAFFRGQLFVSGLNGLATGLGLVILGLKFGWLIGLALCVLGMVPYLGIFICWVPAVIIASVQGGDGTWVPAEQWWLLPLLVTIVFVVVQQVDGLFLTPKIVGDSVGLHPMTVIVSVFAWTLILGGLLGAILAVPLTASIKVLFQRYVWHRALPPEVAPTAAAETLALEGAQN